MTNAPESEDKRLRLARGRSVRAARNLADMTQQELAEATGMSISFVQQIELLGASPSIHHALKISKALGRYVEEIWGALPTKRSYIELYGEEPKTNE